MKKAYLAIIVVFLVLLFDQALKIWIKTTFCYGEERPIMGLEWARLNFVENPGMAFGWRIGGEYGKLALSLFRIVAIGFLIYYVRRLIAGKSPSGLIISFSLILAGAIGNVLDSAFYGLFFTESDYHCINGAAKITALGQGYAGFLHGKVVDMLFFPLVKNNLGGVLFFQPVFNIADSAITIGVLMILLFQRSYFNEQDAKATTVSPKPHDNLEEEIAATEKTDEKIELTNDIDEEKSEENKASSLGETNQETPKS